jgi:hypothetical protein
VAAGQAATAFDFIMLSAVPRMPRVGSGYSFFSTYPAAHLFPIMT